MFLAIAGLLGAVAVPDGTRLATGRVCYTLESGNGTEAKAIGNVMQSVEPIRWKGRRALRIVVHQRLANGRFDMRDEFLVERNSLQPIMLDSMLNGAPHAHLDYSSGKVKGWKAENGLATEISQSLPRQIWEGNLWGLTFAALPLEAGKSVELPTYHYDKGVGRFTLRVKSKERHNVQGRAIDAWLVDAGSSDDRRVDYLISTDGRELGYRAGPMSQMLGGDCTSLN